ncbi:hypothetical protein Aperf_G00000032069 [Anoplocephala perfoliata]
MDPIKLTHYHTAKCSKPAKLNVTMSKEFEKVAKGKGKAALCKINNEKILIKGKTKQVIERKDIEQKNEDEEKKIIVIASKTGKKKELLIYSLKFENEDGFMSFSNVLNEESSKDNNPVKSPSPPLSSNHFPLKAASNALSTTSNSKQDHRSGDSSLNQFCDAQSKTTLVQCDVECQVPPRYPQSQTPPWQQQPQAPALAPTEPPPSTFVTTDVLKTHIRSKPANKTVKKVPAYNSDKSKAKEGKKKVHQHNSRFRSDSSSSSTSSSTYSTSTSTADSFEKILRARSVPTKFSNRNLPRGSGSSSSRSSSISSSASEYGQINTLGTKNLDLPRVRQRALGINP